MEGILGAAGVCLCLQLIGAVVDVISEIDVSQGSCFEFAHTRTHKQTNRYTPKKRMQACTFGLLTYPATFSAVILRARDTCTPLGVFTITRGNMFRL